MSGIFGGDETEECWRVRVLAQSLSLSGSEIPLVVMLDRLVLFWLCVSTFRETETETKTDREREKEKCLDVPRQESDNRCQTFLLHPKTNSPHIPHPQSILVHLSLF